MNRETLPQRKKLPHEIPPWVQLGTRHFITINCEKRDADILCREPTATALLESATFYEQIGRWYMWLMMIMPDHLHFIATFDLQRGVRPIVRAWKSYQAAKLSINWQSDFFEHRLRNDKEYEEKTHYVRMNPVRKGLVQTTEEWPFVMDRIRMIEQT